MKIQCPNCQHEGTVPDDKVPSAGVTVSCPKCNTKFQINPPSDSVPTSKPDFYCPKCGTGQLTSDTCINCRTVFSKFIKEKTTKKTAVEPSQSSMYRNIPVHKYAILPVIILLIALIGLLAWKYYPNRANLMKFAKSNNSAENSSTHKTEEVQTEPISIVGSCKAWKFEDGGYVPGIMFKVTNRLNSKIGSIDFRAVWLKNGNEQFYTASAFLSDLDSGVTSQDIKLVPRKVKVISQSGRFNPQEDVEFLGKDLTVKVYYKVLFAGRDEKLIYDGPFTATFNEVTPFF